MASPVWLAPLNISRPIGSRNLQVLDPLRQCLIPVLSRSMATQADIPAGSPELSQIQPAPTASSPPVRPFRAAPDVLTTVYQFPSMEPLRFEKYSADYLHVPLRRDILHRAVIYEGDRTRQGTASTKWRDEVHGSGHKCRPQKGTGMARLGDKKSPMLRGGGVAFGPKPRDFSTELPRKMYDLAWRVALSYRYRKGELIIVDNVPKKVPNIKNIFESHQWGNADGRSLLITSTEIPRLSRKFKAMGADGRMLPMSDVDVKDLLELGRIIIEKEALDGILHAHESDLTGRRPTATQSQ